MKMNNLQRDKIWKRLAYSIRLIAFSLMLIAYSFLFSCNHKHEHPIADAAKTYTCPMHPQIVSNQPGTCPICGMDLVQVTQGGNQENELMLSSTQVKLANITTQQIAFEDIGKSTVLTGKLVLNENQTEVISSRVGGRIEKLFVKETGEKVTKGQPLYQLYSEELLTLQNDYLLALQQAREFKGNTRYAAFLESAEKKLMLLGMTNLQIEALSKAGKTNPTITFTAPYSGVVAEIPASEGQYVAEGGLLYRLEKLGKIWVEAELYPNEARLVKEGDVVTVVVNGFENESLKAKIIFFSPEFRKGTQIITLRAEIENPEGKYQPGMQANVVLAASGKKSLALPADAVIRDGKGSHVWVEPKEGIFQPRMVTTGLENFEKVEITEGLEENEKVVVTGAYLLYSEFVLKKGGNPIAGHNHSTRGEVKLAEAEYHHSEPAITETDRNIPKEFQAQLRDVLKEYFKIKDALVNSNPEAASQAAQSTNAAIKRTDMTLLKGKTHEIWMEDLNAIDKELKEIRALKNLEKQRKAFAGLSEALHKSLKEFDATNAPVYYQYCSMAFNNNGAYWLSNKKEIYNPFFGKQMERCGETKEVLKKEIYKRK